MADGYVGGYRLARELGRGGSSTVFLALDDADNRYALKLLHPSLALDEQARARLEREARLINSVKDPGIARVYDFEVDADQPFIVTELIEGQTLEQAVRTNGPMPPHGAWMLGAALAATLERVHQAGILHRDLKPSNIALSPKGPVLFDFGVAQAEDATRLTSTGLVSGTAGYVPREVLEGAQPSRASDWWAWLATLLYTRTGRAPFAGSSQASVLAAVVSGRVDTRELPLGEARVFERLLTGPLEELPEPTEMLRQLQHSALEVAGGAEETALGVGADSVDQSIQSVAPSVASEVTEVLDTVGGDSTVQLPSTHNARAQTQEVTRQAALLEANGLADTAALPPFLVNQRPDPWGMTPCEVQAPVAAGQPLGQDLRAVQWPQAEAPTLGPQPRRAPRVVSILMLGAFWWAAAFVFAPLWTAAAFFVFAVLSGMVGSAAKTRFADLSAGYSYSVARGVKDALIAFPRSFLVTLLALCASASALLALVFFSPQIVGRDVGAWPQLVAGVQLASWGLEQVTLGTLVCWAAAVVAVWVFWVFPPVRVVIRGRAAFVGAIFPSVGARVVLRTVLAAGPVAAALASLL